MGRAIAIVMGVLSVTVAAGARAETAAVLPASGEERLPAAVRARAARALRAALREEGVRVVAATALDAPELRACRKTDCGDEVAAAAGADFAAGVAVWSGGGDAPGAATVAVSLITPEGVTYPGTAPVNDGDLALATRTALAAARAKQRLGPGPWVHVTGTPVGARVSVDGTVVGVLPYRGAIAPGRHVIGVRLGGYRPVERTVDVRMTDQAEVELQVALEQDAGAPATPRQVHPAGAPVDRAPAQGGGRSALHRWGPVALGVAGLGLLAVDAVALARRGCELRDASGTCRRGRRLRPGPFAAYAAAGGAAVMGAVLWWLLARDGDEETDTGAGRARITVGPTGLHLSTPF